MRRVSSGFVLTAGLLAAATGLVGYSIQATVLDGSRVAATGSALLSDRVVRDTMAKRVAAAVTAADRTGVPIAPATLARVARRTLREPQFVAAFEQALLELHRQVFGDGGGAIVLPTALVTAAARTAFASADPEQAGVLAPGAGLAVSIDTGSVPHLSQWARLIRNLARDGGVVGLALVALGFTLEGHRPRALMRIGRWALVAGLAELVVFRFLPYVVIPRFGGWAEVVGTVAAAGSNLVALALALAAAGAFLIFVGARWERLGRRQVLAVIPHDPHRHATAADRAWRSRI